MGGLAGFAANDVLTADVFRLAGWTMPLILVASLVGSAVYKRFSGKGFRRLVLGLLTLAEAALVAQGVRKTSVPAKPGSFREEQVFDL